MPSLLTPDPTPSPVPGPLTADPPIPTDPPVTPAPTPGVTPPADPSAPTPPEPPKPAGAPEKYDFKAPDGVKLDQGMIDDFSKLAKEANMTNEAAQKFVDMQLKSVSAWEKTQAEAQAKANTDMIEGWKAESTADKEIGGANLPQNSALAIKALTKYGTPELVKLLDDSGLGNHKELFRLLYRIGKDIKEPNLLEGNNGPAQPTAAKVLFGKVDKQ